MNAPPPPEGYHALKTPPFPADILNYVYALNPETGDPWVCNLGRADYVPVFPTPEALEEGVKIVGGMGAYTVKHIDDPIAFAMSLAIRGVNMCMNLQRTEDGRLAFAAIIITVGVGAVGGPERVQ
jgi:hypothetical protein